VEGWRQEAYKRASAIGAAMKSAALLLNLVASCHGSPPFSNSPLSNSPLSLSISRDLI